MNSQVLGFTTMACSHRRHPCAAIASGQLLPSGCSSKLQEGIWGSQMGEPSVAAWITKYLLPCGLHSALSPPALSQCCSSEGHCHLLGLSTGSRTEWATPSCLPRGRGCVSPRVHGSHLLPHRHLSQGMSQRTQEYSPPRRQDQNGEGVGSQRKGWVQFDKGTRGRQGNRCVSTGWCHLRSPVPYHDPKPWQQHARTDFYGAKLFCVPSKT